jgi:putative nucleic acid binding protein
MKKKILLIIVAVFLVLGYAGYKYVFKGPRDVSSESASLTTTAVKLKTDFSSDQNTANTKYIGKTIIISGMVTEKTNESITLNNGVICILSTKEKNTIALNTSVKIKGKVDGYDDLFEQVKLTESSIVN